MTARNPAPSRKRAQREAVVRWTYSFRSHRTAEALFNPLWKLKDIRDERRRDRKKGFILGPIVRVELPLPRRAKGGKG